MYPSEKSLKNLRPKINHLTEEQLAKGRKLGVLARQRQARERKELRRAMEKAFSPDPKKSNIKVEPLFLPKEPKVIKELFKDFLQKRLSQVINDKTLKEHIMIRLSNLLLDRELSPNEFLKALDMTREIIGEKETDKTIVLQQQNNNTEVNLEKLKEIKELLNGNNKQS